MELAGMAHRALIEILEFVGERDVERAASLAYVFPDLPHYLSELRYGVDPESFRLRIKDYEQEYGVCTGDVSIDYLSTFNSIFPDID